MTFFHSGWSATPPNGGAKYRLRLEVNVVGQNVAANQTTVEFRLQMQKDRNWDGFFEYGASWTVTVGPGIPTVQDAGKNPNAPWLGWNSATIVGTMRKTFTHNANGTFTIPVGATYNGANTGWAVGNLSLSSTMALPTIVRATRPTVSPSPAPVGSVVTIGLPRAVGSYTHDVTWECGSQSGAIGNGLGASATWTVPNVLSQFPSRPQKPIVITAVTKSGATVIGQAQVTLLARTPPLPPVPPTADVPTAAEQFDIRARVVEFAAGKWEAKRQLPASSVSIVDPSSATATCSLTISKLRDEAFEDYSVVDIDVFDGTNWIFTDHRFVLSRLSGDSTDPTQTVEHSGTEFVDFFLGFGYAQKDYNWPGSSNPGMILLFLINEAKKRGWGPRINFDFSSAKTSLGEPWANRDIDLKVSKGTPISQVLEGLVSDGFVEYKTSYHDDKAWLTLFNPGTGANYANVGADPVVNLSLAKLKSAPRRASIEKRLTRVTAQGDDKVQITLEQAAFDADVFGQLEGWVSASGVTTNAAARSIARNALRDNSSANSERTFEYDSKSATKRLYPYVIYEPGDWVIIPEGDSTRSDRLSQITITKTVDNEISITALTGDRILSGTASLAKRQAAQTGGSIAGGNMSTPATLDSRIPAAPIVTSITSNGYWNSDGAARAAVTVNFDAVTDALSGQDIAVDLYEIWWRDDVGAQWALRASTDQPTLEIPDWDILNPVEIRVRARSEAGIFGEFSLNQPHTTGQPTEPMAAPTTPTVTANALGTLSIAWDGGIGAAPTRPVQFAYTRAEIAESGLGVFTAAGAPLLQAGDAVIEPGSYRTWLVRLIAVDRLGIESPASSVVSITTIDPGLILRVPKAPTGLSYTTTSAFSADGTVVEAWFDLDWDEVTQDVDGSPIDIYGYEAWGHPDTETNMNLMVSTQASEVRAMVSPGENWVIEVRAVSDVGARGGFSPTLTAVADGVVAPLGVPTTPLLTSTRGMMRVEWDGLIDGLAPPTSFRSVRVEHAPTDTMVYVRAGQSFVRGGGAIFIPGDVGQEYTVRLTAVAGDGVSGNPSATASVVVEGISTVDFTPLIENMLSEPRIETSTDPTTGVKLYNDGIVAYGADGEPTVFISAEDGTIYFASGVISGDAVVAGTINASKLDVDSVVATLIASELGASLNLASNASVNILVGGAIAGVQDDIDGIGNNLDDMQTYYKFGPSGAEITSPNSPFSVQIASDQISMLASGAVVSYWNAAGMVVPSLIADQTATIGAHQFRREAARTTVRAL
jgi:hypothetical protein